MAKGKAKRMVKKKKSAARPRKGPRGRPTDLAPYYRLLADPCNGQLVPAPYAGIGSSLLVRTVQVLSPQVIVTGNGALDFVIECAPFNYPSTFKGAVAPFGATVTSSVEAYGVGSTATFLSSSAVREFRPVAACAKWVPNGPISGRSGVIGMSYAPSMTLPLGSTVYTNQAHINQRVAGNGTEPHEVIWLPSFGDERFTTPTEPDIAGVGTLRICGSRVDATQVSTACIANGYVELTCVYEWAPSSSAGANSGVVPSITTPSPHSLNSVLSRIKDIGKFVFRHAGHVIDLYDNAFSPAYNGPPFLTY